MTLAAALPTAVPDAAIGLAVAALLGLAVGIERQWSGHASGPDARFAGARTFLLLGAVGGLVGRFAADGLVALAAVLLASAGLLVAAAYVVASRRGSADPDGTTEMAALVVLGLGAASGLGEIRVASAATVVMVLALHEKSRIHHFVSRLDDWELRGAVQFAVLALVVLPILPVGPYGPLGGIRPQALWALVLVFSGLNFVGYVARRVVGTTRGYGLAGLAGGLVSSTAVTLAFARRSRLEPEAGYGLAVGTIAASTVLPVRVAAVTVALNPFAARELVPYVAVPLGTGLILLAIAIRQGRTGSGEAEAPMPPPESPLRLAGAIRLALLFQLSLMALEWVRLQFGETGILPLAALLGLTDMDALTISMTRLEPRAAMASLAALAIGVGLLSNTLLKGALAVGLGSGLYRRRAGLGFAALALATSAALLFL